MATGTLVILMALKLVWDAHFYDGYDPDLPLNVQIRSDEQLADYRLVDFTYQSEAGQNVPTLMAMPKGDGPFPALLFLHGIGQQNNFVKEIAAPFVKEGYVIVCFDQLMQGERDMDDENYLKQALAFRHRAAATVIDTRRLIDYLETRPDIDSDRVYLLGASYGSITGSVATAMDKRIKGAILCYGGGDIGKLVDSKIVGDTIGPAVGPLKSVARFLMAPSDPCRWVSGIAPRPALFQNGRYDTVVSPAAGQALIDAAGDPKDVIWYDSDHIGLDEAHVWVVLNDAIDWLKAHDN